MPTIPYKVVFNQVLLSENIVILTATRYFEDKEEYEDWLTKFYNVNGEYEKLDILWEGWACH